jgi:hypothetical protein
LKAKEKAPETLPKPQPAPNAADIAPKRPPAPKPRKMESDPLYLKFKAEEDAALGKQRQFDALSPEGKIAELQRQLREERARAAAAEDSLAREKELRYNDNYHNGGTIELLKNQLEAARARIKELESA